MNVKAIWEFDSDVEDLDPKQVDVQGLAKDLAQRELDYLIKHGEIQAEDFDYEVDNDDEIKCSKLWTLFVLDFDATYSLEKEESVGVAPVVYLVPECKIVEVQQFAFDAGQRFIYADESDSRCIGDYFEAYLDMNKIPYQEIGIINLTFGERQVDYLADYIPKEVV